MHRENNKLSLSSALILGLNAAVGAGIFSAPLALYRTAGPIGIASYLLATFLILTIGLAFTRLLSIYPSRSFLYDFPARWGGGFAGTLSLSLYTTGLVVALGLLGKIAGSLLVPISNIGTTNIWGSVILLIAALGSQLGTTWLTWGQYLLFGLTLLPMLLISVLGLRFGSYQNFLPLAPHGFANIAWALPIVVFGFFGFEAVPALFSRIHNPAKNSARAIVGTILITGSLYMLFVGSITYLLPAEAYATSSLSEALLYALPSHHWLVNIINWAIIITIAGTLYSMFPAITNLVSQVQRKVPVLFVRCVIPVCALGALWFAQNLGVLFNITALGIAGSYGMATLTLALQGTTKKPSDLVLGLAATAASAIVCLCAIVGL